MTAPTGEAKNNLVIPPEKASPAAVVGVSGCSIRYVLEHSCERILGMKTNVYVDRDFLLSLDPYALRVIGGNCEHGLYPSRAFCCSTNIYFPLTGVCSEGLETFRF